MTMEQPVVVIGAGVAGLAAAAKLGQSRIPVVVLEARERTGGRIFTKSLSAGKSSIELGAEFIHGLPPEICELLPTSWIEEVQGDNWCVSGQGLVPCRFFSEVDSILDAMDDSDPDESFLAFLERMFPNPGNDAGMDEAKKRAIGYVSGFNAADPGLIGVHWLVAEMRAEEKIAGHRAFRSQNGYADLLDVFLRQIARSNIKIQTGTMVEQIVWKPGSVQVKASSEKGSSTFTTPLVLITLPLPLLEASAAKGVVEFIPPLPPEKIASATKLAMGKVIRIGLRFRYRFWDRIAGAENPAKTLSDMSFLFSDDEFVPTWWTTMPRREPVITGWAPFRSAEKLSEQGPSMMVEQALRTLSRLLGVSLRDLEKCLEDAHFHDWQSDPFSRGAYSYAKVGADGAHAALAAPVKETLFFAGEATDTSANNGTVHGAIASGYRAAQEIIQAWRRRSIV
jgi:monoamine oxidase